MGSVARINGLVAILAIAPACDSVFGLDTPNQSTPCGVFDDPVPVPIDPRLVQPVRLTFTHPGDGGLGVVNARLDDMGLRRDLTVKWDGAMWAYDDTRMNGFDELASQNLRHMTATRFDENRMYGSLRLSSDGKWHVYAFARTLMGTTMKWAQDADAKEVAISTGQDSYPGGELVVLTGANDDRQRSVPVFRYASASDFSWTTAIAERPAGADTSWSDAFSGGHSATELINAGQWSTGGSLIRLQVGPQKNANVLFYAARPRGTNIGSDLFVSLLESGRYPVGTPIASVNSDQDDVEPWVDDACTTLVFRRADPAGDRSNDDGDTITDGVIYQSTVIPGSGPDGS
ncbi:MAG TPA: hypothetical protein VGM90_11840 [Kofleriaceae bacterium]